MKILIFGAGGMIGHKMYQRLAAAYPDTWACVHRSFSEYRSFDIFNSQHVIENFDVADFSKVEERLNEIRPDLILNCVGITIRKEKIKDLEYSKHINSEFPHLLKSWVDAHKKRLIHFSTDCVFDGKADLYTESSLGTADDNYGLTKYWGEVQSANSLTLRSSMIGPELHGKTELLEWLKSQSGKTIKGFSNVIYSGVTTDVMAELVLDIIKNHSDLCGLYQVASKPISKYDLLLLLNKKLGLNVVVENEPGPVSKKILDASLIWKKIGFISPSWDEMADQLANPNKI